MIVAAAPPPSGAPAGLFALTLRPPHAAGNNDGSDRLRLPGGFSQGIAHPIASGNPATAGPLPGASSQAIPPSRG
ncbi:protein of unknown function [Methylacidimicrobium sp. AP8]|nr:protein of unknown function [Methylacidimicrobium sp. AP8]